jgi:hypothetical protein
MAQDDADRVLSAVLDAGLIEILSAIIGAVRMARAIALCSGLRRGGVEVAAQVFSGC